MSITFSACVFRVKRIQMLNLDPARKLRNPGFPPGNSGVQDSRQENPFFPGSQTLSIHICSLMKNNSISTNHNEKSHKYVEVFASFLNFNTFLKTLHLQVKEITLI